MSILKIIGIPLLVAGASVVSGVCNLLPCNASTGGNISVRLAGAFGSRTRFVQKSVIQIGISAACAVAGFIFFKNR